MKKFFANIILIIVFLIIYLLQSNFFNWFTIAGVKPNLFIILVVIIGLFAGKRMGIIFGIIFGLLIDIYIRNTIGISAVTLGILGYIAGYLDKNFSKDSKLTIMIIISVATFIFELVIYISAGLVNNSVITLIPFFKILGIEVLYNIILVILLYPLLQRAGYALESVFKGEKVYTRYF